LNKGGSEISRPPIPDVRLDEAMTVGAAAGTRYPEPQMKGVQL
jgi:hypothetical protein